MSKICRISDKAYCGRDLMFPITRSKRNFFIISLTVTLALIGCGGPIAPGQMMPQYSASRSAPPEGRFWHSIVLSEVGGVNETNPMMDPNMGEQELYDEIKKTLAVHRFYCLTEIEVPYTLKIFFVKMDRPPGDTATTVTSCIRYTLTRVKDNKIIFDKTITASATKTPNDAFVSAKRLRLANAEAIEKNIALFLEILRKDNMPN